MDPSSSQACCLSGVDIHKRTAELDVADRTFGDLRLVSQSVWLLWEVVARMAYTGMPSFSLLASGGSSSEGSEELRDCKFRDCKLGSGSRQKQKPVRDAQ